MTTDLAAGTVETNVFSLIWNRRLLVVAFALAFAGVGLLVSELRQKEYTAEASVLLSQPAPTAADPARDEARYVADQVAVMKSLPIAERASEIARKDPENPITVDARDFQRRTLITASAESNFVSVSFHAGRPNAAATGANATVRAYEEATRDDLRRRHGPGSPAARSRDRECRGACCHRKRSGCEGCRRPRQPPESRARSYRRRARRWPATASPQSTKLMPARRADPRLSPCWLSPSFSEPSSAPGSLTGRARAVRSFSRRSTRRRYSASPCSRRYPTSVEAGPALKLPALVSPATPAAREFRFLAASLVVNAESNGQSRGRTNKVRQPAFVAFVSPSEGDGSTTVAANTALAAAQQGHRVQALDADVEAPGSEEPARRRHTDVKRRRRRQHDERATAERRTDIARTAQVRSRSTLRLR